MVSLATAVALLGAWEDRSFGQTIAPPFAADYSLTDLGSVPAVPGPFGGVTLLAGDPDTLLIGGSANNGGGAIYSIGVVRGAGGHITGFSGSATLFATAPYIDGGLAYGPGGVLFYTGYPTNVIGEIKPGDTSTDKTVDLTLLGVSSSVGTLGFVPSYAPGAGEFKIISYTGGGMYNATLTPDGSGTFNISPATLTTPPGGGPEGFIYITPGSPVFSPPSMLISDYSLGQVNAYHVDSDGNPIVSTAQPFITGLTGAEGAFTDPVTGDFLFSTFGGGNHLVEVQGFMSAVPEPSTLVLAIIAGVGLSASRRPWRVRRSVGH
jgi:hypothetical protein